MANAGLGTILELFDDNPLSEEFAKEKAITRMEATGWR